MMSELNLLLRLELRRGRYAWRKLKPALKVLLPVGILVAGVGILGTLALYDVLLYAGFAALGQPGLMLTLMMVLASLVTLVFTVFRGAQTLFLGRDLPQLMSLPLHPGSVAGARLTRLYLSDVGFSALVLVPAVVVHQLFTGFDAGLTLRAALGLLALPVVPLVLGCAVSALILWVASFFRRSSAVSLVATLALFVGTMALSFVNPVTLDYTALGAVLERSVFALYPPAALWSAGVVQGRALPLAAFVLLGAGVLAAAAWLCGRLLRPMYHRLSTRRAARRAVRLTGAAVRGSLAALVEKEVRRLFSSSVYLFNAAIGALLLLIAAAAVAVLPGETIRGALASVGYGPELLTIMLPYALSFFAMMTIPGAVAVSLEGRQLWLVKSLPIRMEHLLWAKTLVNLVLAVVPALLVSALLWWKLALPLGEGLFALALPALFGAFVSFSGVVANLLLPRFDWATEAQIVKRAGSLLLAMGFGFGALVLCAVGHALLGAWLPVTLMVLLTAGFAALLFTWGVRKMQRL